MKKCTKCKQEKEREEFHIVKTNKDGLHTWCRLCKKEYDKKYRKTDKIQSMYKSDPYRYKKQQYQKMIAITKPELIMYRTTKCRAKSNKIPFDIELSDIIIPKYCPVLGIELKQNRTGNVNGKPKMNSPSLDKIIPELGYVKGNVWVISYRANMMKSNATLDELKIFCKNMLKMIDGINNNTRNT